MARRLTFFITELEIGGAEKCLTELACRVNRDLFTPEVVVLADVPKRCELFDRLTQCHVPVKFLGVRNLSNLLPGFLKLVRYLLIRRPVILQTFLFHANLLGRLAARIAAVPAVVCGLRVAEREQRWHLWLDRLTSSWVDMYVCVSRAVAKFSAEIGMLPESKLAVIPNAVDVSAIDRQPWIDLEMFFREAAGDRSGSAVSFKQPEVAEADRGCRTVSDNFQRSGYFMVAAGRLEHQKGFDWLLMAVAPLLRQLPALKLLIVGSGSQEFRLRTILDKGRINHKVRLLGFRYDTLAILKSADLFLLSSRWEGMPNVLLEAMAARKPVVCVDAEGVREALGPWWQHQLVAQNDESEFRRAILWHYHERANSTALGGLNRERVEKKFSWPRVVERYEHVWSRLID